MEKKKSRLGKREREGKTRPAPRVGPAPRLKTPAEAAIVFEDQEILVVDKPHGLLSATPEGTKDDSVFEQLKRRAGPRGRGESQKVWIVHRLDREASGLLVFAKTERAFHWLKEDLRARRVSRLYWALIEGEIPKGTKKDEWRTIQSFLVDDARGVVRQTSKPEGSRTKGGDEAELAVTHYRPIARGEGRTLVELRLDSGRRHQIRVHMSGLGHPLAGDHRYGAVTDPLTRMALHAAELTLTHPGTQERMTFRSDAAGTFHRAVGLAAPKIRAVEGGGAVITDKKASPPERIDTSWEPVAEWYDEAFEEGKNDHFDDVILPGTLRLAEPKKGKRILDLACGEGTLARRMAGMGAAVVGVDAAPSLIAAAKKKREPEVKYLISDARDVGKIGEGPFDVVTCVMAIMNIDPLEPVLRGVASLTAPGGSLVLVLLHPAFRAPRQTKWGLDEEVRPPAQYRRIDGYLSAGQFEIVMNPGAVVRGEDKKTTWTFHRPLQTYVQALAQAGFMIDRLEEWPSLRGSGPGRRSDEQTRIRLEIPLFLGIRAKKFGGAPEKP